MSVLLLIAYWTLVAAPPLLFVAACLVLIAHYTTGDWPAWTFEPAAKPDDQDWDAWEKKVK